MVRSGVGGIALSTSEGVDVTCSRGAIISNLQEALKGFGAYDVRDLGEIESKVHSACRNDPAGYVLVRREPEWGGILVERRDPARGD